MNKKNLSGMVLSGGQSQRMGSPKALLDFRGKALIEHALSLLSEICSEVFIVTKNPELYQKFGTKILTDLYADGGPMGGIYTGLQHASNHWSVVLACDMPFVRKELLLGLLQQLKNEPQLKAVIPSAPANAGEENILQPLCALYSKNCLPFFHQRLKSGQISLFAFAEYPAACSGDGGAVEITVSGADTLQRTHPDTPQFTAGVGSFQSLRVTQTKIVPWSELDPEDKDAASFININTRRDYLKNQGQVPIFLNSAES